MSEVAGFRVPDVFARCVPEQLKQLSAGANGGRVHSLDPAFQIGGDRFVGAHAQNRVCIGGALAHHQRDLRKLVTFSQNQSLDFFGDGSNFYFAIPTLKQSHRSARQRSAHILGAVRRHPCLRFSAA